MKVLLTRPLGRNQEMVDALKLRGIDYWLTPLLEIVATHQGPSESQLKAEKFIFISANAVHFAAEQLDGHLPQGCHYFAVGEATALALGHYGIVASSAPALQQDSEGLLTLPQLQAQAVSRHNITIVRGLGGREVLAETLEKRGAKVDYWQVYLRQRPDLDAKVVCQQWLEFGIDTLVITSGESLTNLVELVPKELFAWLQSCHIIVPSGRIQTQASSLGFHKVTNAHGANTQAVLTALTALA